MSAALVDYRVEHGIAIFELNNPPANTYTYEMMRALDECILQARFDPEVAVLVLRGKGERFFSAGADIHMLRSVDPTFKYYFCPHANETLLRPEQKPKPLTATPTGATEGGGRREVGIGWWPAHCRTGRWAHRSARSGAGGTAWDGRHAAFAAPGRESARH